MLPSPADTDATAAEIAPQVRSLQIIHGSLMAGVGAYLAVICSQGLRFSEEDTALPLIPLGLAAMGVVMSFVLPPILRQAGLAAFRGHSPIASTSLVGAFQSGHIVGIATLEGAGFLSCFALTGGFGMPPRWFLLVPIMVLLLMLIRFPRVSSVVDWISMTREEMAL